MVSQEPERAYAVLLVRPDHYAASGVWVYRGTQLPAPGDTIEVEDEVGAHIKARVTRVRPESDYSIGAKIEQPWPVE